MPAICSIHFLRRFGISHCSLESPPEFWKGTASSEMFLILQHSSPTSASSLDQNVVQTELNLTFSHLNWPVTLPSPFLQPRGQHQGILHNTRRKGIRYELKDRFIISVQSTANSSSCAPFASKERLTTSMPCCYRKSIVRWLTIEEFRTVLYVL